MTESEKCDRDRVERLFSRCRTVKQRIKDLRLHMESLRASAGVSSGMGSSAGGGSGRDLSDIAVAVVSHERSICRQIDDLTRLYDQCSAIIDAVSECNPMAGEVLSMRYLGGRPWRDIRRRFDCCDRTVFRARSDGLDIAAKIGVA